MKLTFQQAARGVNKEVHVNVTDTCPKCQGTKAEPGTRAVKCHHCNGTGMVSMVRVVLKLFWHSAKLYLSTHLFSFIFIQFYAAVLDFLLN